MNKKRVLFIALSLLTFVGANAVAAQQGQKHSTYISKNQAVHEAYRHAGVKADDVAICKTKIEKEKGRIFYNVEFIAGKVEYEFDIDATTGKILGLDGELAQGSAAPHKGFIGVAKAKSIALDYAGIRPDSPIEHQKIELDRDDGLVVYEVNFFYNGKKYEYEIDAVTGKVLEAEFD